LSFLFIVWLAGPGRQRVFCEKRLEFIENTGFDFFGAGQEAQKIEAEGDNGNWRGKEGLCMGTLLAVRDGPEGLRLRFTRNDRTNYLNCQYESRVPVLDNWAQIGGPCIDGK
jgi:hypothetical protein